MELSAIIWMFVILKIPIIAALALIWYAIQAPEPAATEDEDRGGGSDRSDAPRPRGPRSPRRGPHASPSPPAPPRVRTTAAARRSRRTPR